MEGTMAAHHLLHRASTSLGLAQGEYHYLLSGIRHNGHGGSGFNGGFLGAASGPVAIISSDNLVRLFDPSRLTNGMDRLEADAGIVGKHADVTSMCPVPGGTGSGIMTAGRDGLIRHWDPRAGDASASPTWERPTKLQTAYLSLASCRHSHMWAAGTELAHSIATVEVWDDRQMAQPVSSYVECHSDDICSLSFSFHHPGSLVSGSTDGLVNMYNPSFPADEDDALLQVINHGSSIHQAGFLGDGGDAMVLALSHDETLSIYRREDSEDATENAEMLDADGSDAMCVAAFGDVRARFDCNYVAEILPQVGGFCIAAGNFSQQRLDLVDLPYSTLDSAPSGIGKTTRYKGAHGEEVVRSVLPYGTGASAGLISAGEDGMVRFWPSRAGGESDAASAQHAIANEREGGSSAGSEHQSKRRRSEARERERKHFKPY